jgi:hypothetical protein
MHAIREVQGGVLIGSEKRAGTGRDIQVVSEAVLLAK